MTFLHSRRVPKPVIAKMRRLNPNTGVIVMNRYFVRAGGIEPLRESGFAHCRLATVEDLPYVARIVAGEFIGSVPNADLPIPEEPHLVAPHAAEVIRIDHLRRVEIALEHHARGLSQTETAEAMGIDRKTLRDSFKLTGTPILWDRGRRPKVAS